MRWAPVRILLTPERVDYADNVGGFRRSRGFVWGLRNANGLKGSYDDLLAIDRMGARCEAAGKVYLNPIPWHALTEKFKNAPDLGDFIDVKGRWRDTDDLIVHKDAKSRFAYLFISAEHHPEYLIFGWAWGCEVKQDRYLRKPSDRPEAYYMPRDDLPHSPEELREIVHERSAA